MPFLKVSSSQIHSWQFDPVEERLSVKFNHKPCSGTGKTGDNLCGTCRGEGNTGVYHYEGVSPAIWAQLRDAESKGSAHGQLIKKGGYKFQFVPNGAA